MYLVSGYARTASAAPPPPPFINYSQIELVQVGAKDSAREEKKGPRECCSSVQVLRWCQTPWASPEAVCLTKILFTVSQRGCQAPISIMLPVAFCGNEFHRARDALWCSLLLLCILCGFFFFFPSVFPPISPFHLSLFLVSPSVLFLTFFPPNRWIMSFSVTPHQWFQDSRNTLHHVVGVLKLYCWYNNKTSRSGVY